MTTDRPGLGSGAGGLSTAPAFQAIVASSRDAIYSYADDGQITSWNVGAERLLGYPADEAIGQTVGLIVPEGGEAAAAHTHQRLLGGELLDHFETELRRKDGQKVAVSLSTSRIVDRAGRVAGVAAIARDITERRALECERDALLSELERANAELQRSNADLEQFAYAASHDLSEPLRVIAGMVQLLERQYGAQLDDRARDYIQRTVAATGRMRRLIDDLLTYGRIGREDLEWTAVDCRAVAQNAVGDLEQAIIQTGAEVEIGSLPTVPGDPGQLESLFLNLIGNSIKFHGEEPPQVRVSAERESQWWTFTVNDTGIGIPPEHAHRVFKMFKRLQPRDRYPGTGIGLAMCQRIVEGHGGRIWVVPQTHGVSLRFTLSAEDPR